MITRTARRLCSAAALAALGVGLLLPPLALAQDATIAVVDNAFRPRDVTVELGDVLRFSWQGENRHGVQGPWGVSHPGCSSLSTRDCASRGDAPFDWTTNAVGTFEYNCQVHSSMTGSFTVLERAGSPSPTPTASPSPSVAPTPTALPTPTASPTASPTATPSASPTPTPSPTPTETEPAVGPPSPSPTAPAVVIEPTGPPPTYAPGEQATLEPFVPAIDPNDALASEVASERAEAAALARDRRRDTTPRIVAFALVFGTLVALVQFVLLGPAWITED